MPRHKHITRYGVPKTPAPAVKNLRSHLALGKSLCSCRAFFLSVPLVCGRFAAAAAAAAAPLSTRNLKPAAAFFVGYRPSVFNETGNTNSIVAPAASAHSREPMWRTRVVVVSRSAGRSVGRSLRCRSRKLLQRHYPRRRTTPTTEASTVPRPSTVD